VPLLVAITLTEVALQEAWEGITVHASVAFTGANLPRLFSVFPAMGLMMAGTCWQRLSPVSGRWGRLCHIVEAVKGDKPTRLIRSIMRRKLGRRYTMPL
jgi:hypothetical protein